MTEEVRYFLTVDWCNQGQRGIFADIEGNAFSKETPHTREEMFEILGAFFLVLEPQSLPLTAAELAEYTKGYPLGEYSDQYVVVLKPGQKKAW